MGQERLLKSVACVCPRYPSTMLPYTLQEEWQAKNISCLILTVAQKPTCSIPSLLLFSSIFTWLPAQLHLIVSTLAPTFTLAVCILYLCFDLQCSLKTLSYTSLFDFLPFWLPDTERPILSGSPLSTINTMITTQHPPTRTHELGSWYRYYASRVYQPWETDREREHHC